MSARAMARRWRWPPESLDPWAPTSVLYPGKAVSCETTCYEGCGTLTFRETHDEVVQFALFGYADYVFIGKMSPGSSAEPDIEFDRSRE